MAKNHDLCPDTEAKQYILSCLGLSSHAQLSKNVAGARELPIDGPLGSQPERESTELGTQRGRQKALCTLRTSARVGPL